MIKIGGYIGAINTLLLIFLTAIVGVYFARIQGLNTLSSGLKNIYQKKTPIFDLLAGASIGVAALLLIIPGFLTDSIGFLLLIPFTRKIIISFLIRNNKSTTKETKDKNIIEAEIIEDKKDEL
tara:strand:+ start:3443 stop:3811 length:369 start_codon:yes stop_codon:yes gene_type:complete